MNYTSLSAAKLRRTFILSSFCFFLPWMSISQDVAPAPDDKAVVYFARANSVGALINFTFFDSLVVIGQFSGPNYMRYECEPGFHIFWARSENRDYITANLDAGKIYVVDVIPTMGAIKSGVKLQPINSDTYRLKTIQKLLTKKPPLTFTPSKLGALQIRMSNVVERGLKRLSQLNVERLPSLGAHSFSPEELKFVKKKRKRRK